MRSTKNSDSRPYVISGKPVLTRKEFASRVRAGVIKSGAAPDVALRASYSKAFLGETAAENGAEEAGDGILKWVISSDRRDRHKDIIEQSGFDFSEYNGVVLWAHASFGWSAPPPFPLGKSVNGFQVITLPNGAKATVASCQFALGVGHELAETAYKLARIGIIPDTSVGITPIEFQETRDETYGYWMHFQRHYLDEWSLVVIGANYDVEMVSQAAKAAGINMAPVLPWAEQLLDLNSALVSRSHLEAIAKVFGACKAFSLPGVKAADLKAALAGAAAVQRALEEIPAEEEDEEKKPKPEEEEPEAEAAAAEEPTEEEPDGGQGEEEPEAEEEKGEEEEPGEESDGGGEEDDEEVELEEDEGEGGDEEPVEEEAAEDPEAGEGEGGEDGEEEVELEIEDDGDPEGEDDEEDELDPTGATRAAA